MNFYIASKLENYEAVKELSHNLKIAGHYHTYDWTEHGPVYSKGLKCIKEISLLELKGVEDSDYVIVLWPGGRGTHVELGYAIAKNKNVIIHTPIENHHLATSETCAFYHHPNVTMIRRLEELWKILPLP